MTLSMNLHTYIYIYIYIFFFSMNKAFMFTAFKISGKVLDQVPTLRVALFEVGVLCWFPFFGTAPPLQPIPF